MISTSNLADATNTFAFGSYERSSNGWSANMGRENHRIIPFKIEPSWLGIKLSNQNTSLELKRCFHYWK